MNQPSTAHSRTVVDTETVPPVSLATLPAAPPPSDLSFREGVYDPRNDPRNSYPLLAQHMLMNQAYRERLTDVCKDICEGGMFGYKNEPRALASCRTVALKGFAMGFDLVRAMETIKVIHGMPTIRGPQALHLIRERTRGSTLDCEESTDDACVWMVARPGKVPKRFAGTRAEVDAAGLPASNPLWNKYKKRMLKWHVFSEAAQEMFGDVLMGSYISEEMDVGFEDDMSKAAASPRPAPQAKKSTPATKSAGKKDSTQAKASAAQLAALADALTDLVAERGARKPTEDMDEEEAAAVKAEWNSMRHMAWEEAVASALDGKVVERQTMLAADASKILAAIQARIAEAKEG